VLMNGILVLAALGALGACFGLGSFSSLAFLWQLPLLFAGLWLGLVLLAFLFLVLWCLPISLDQPVEADSKADRRVLYLYEELALTLLQVKIHTTGLEKLPQEGRFLLVCNHLSLLDPLILHIYTKKSQLAFISKRENDQLFIVNKLMHKTLCQPINRENDREALKTILKCVDILEQDKASIAVFPEGYTSRTGHLQPFRNGVFKIAQRAKVPIVVCTLRGTAPIFRNAAHLRRTHVYLDLLEVLPASQLKGPTKDIGDYVFAAMAQNLGDPMPDTDHS
jgi:1-acyl-sn-glycerol-3-phosphate acyltransferase